MLPKQQKLSLTHCDLVMTYGNGDLGPHWLRYWLVDLSSVRSSDIHLRAISLEIPQPVITNIHLKIDHWKFYSNVTGANVLNTDIFILKWSRVRVNPVHHTPTSPWWDIHITWYTRPTYQFHNLAIPIQINIFIIIDIFQLYQFMQLLEAWNATLSFIEILK